MKQKHRDIILILLVMFVTIGVIAIKYHLSKKLVMSHLLSKEYFLQQPLLNELIPNGTNIEILIDKSDYTLQIFVADTLVKTYSVVFGGNPIDDKLMQGDQCTPEGIFYINSKYPHKFWSKFIWLNYPTADSWKKHNQAKKEGNIPKNAKIGGEIGIHGVPQGQDFAIDRRINWTLGCISLKNDDLNEIYPFINKKTEIKIQK